MQFLLQQSSAKFWLDKNGTIGLGFLWLNVIGALLVMMLSLVVEGCFMLSRK